MTIGNAIAELPVFLVLAMRPVEHAHIRSEQLQSWPITLKFNSNR